MHRDKMNTGRDALALGLHFQHADPAPGEVVGEVFFRMEDAVTGRTLHEFHKKNLITLDAGILAAILLKDPSSRTNGINMLAVGTGATGALLSPDAPDNKQRKLNAEVARKAFASTTFRDTNGAAVSYPTNIVDYTVSFSEGEAVGPLNEMGLLSTISSNVAVKNHNPDVFPARDSTRDLTNYDILANVLNFGVVTKSSTARLSLTWRITSG